MKKVALVMAMFGVTMMAYSVIEGVELVKQFKEIKKQNRRIKTKIENLMDRLNNNVVDIPKTDYEVL